MIDLKLTEGEALALREVLSQTAAYGSLQLRLIDRIDAKLEETHRPRRTSNARRTRPHERTPRA
jgi:hypothetical protein